MSKVCEVTGKKPSVGHSVSHSNRKTLRRYLPNLMTKKIFDPKTGTWIKMKVSAAGLRTLSKRMK
jgi:large subunit ribosomal protein L28